MMTWLRELPFRYLFPKTPLHLEADEGVSFQPGFFHLRSEAIAQSLLEHPNQRRTNWGILVNLNAIAAVARAQFAQFCRQFVRLLQRCDHPREHLRQFLGLQADLALEQRPDLGREFEQTPVELFDRAVISDGNQRRTLRKWRTVIEFMFNLSQTS